MEEPEGKTDCTRARLLQAAGEVFAQRGFRAATIREISRQARANVAAVNYHFRDKEGLYMAVLEHALRFADQQYPPHLESGEDASVEERLRAFVRAVLMRLLDEGRPAWHGKLMAREITEPTLAFDEVVEKGIRPLHDHLRSIVRDFLGDSAREDLVRYCALSIIGQCIFYHHSRPVIDRLYQLDLGSDGINTLTAHISRFSVGAMKALSEGRHPEGHGLKASGLRVKEEGAI